MITNLTQFIQFTVKTFGNDITITKQDGRVFHNGGHQTLMQTMEVA